MSLNTQITLSKGGTEERTLPISRIQIPDMWHLAERIRTTKTPWAGPAAATMILECWTLCHDFKNHIATLPD